MNVFLSGGLGYIGSHIATLLLQQNHEVIIADSLFNSKIEVLDKIKLITGKSVKFYKCDCSVFDELSSIFKKEKIDAIIHLAGLKAVGESCEKPLLYYENNLMCTINLLKCCDEFGVRKFIFSSSATVYDANQKMPVDENGALKQTNPYGRTKFFSEEIIKDFAKTQENFSAVILRYFNPIGAHESGLLGEDPNGIPNNLMPYISKVATGKLKCLNIFGNDYDTKDGTGVRDYIHVCDLAQAHVDSLKFQEKNCGTHIFNIGTGKGYSVLDIVNAYNKVCGNKVKYKFTKRRDGDVSEIYACPDKAKKDLNFVAEYDLDDMCRSSYNFELKQK